MAFKKVSPAKTTLGTKIPQRNAAASFRDASHAQRPPTPITVQKKGKPAPLNPMDILAAPQGRGGMKAM